MSRKKALITGITGQDGSYLAELLLEKGYEVHGIKRRSSSFNTDRIDHLVQSTETEDPDFVLHYGDLSDSGNLINLIQSIQPDEIYNLGAQSHVKVSFESPEYTANISGLGTLRLLEAIRILGLTQKTRFYQASTSELFGKVQEVPQTEATPFYPRSPYACAKLYSYWITINYRESYGIFACNGILFNHESPRRGETFVTRKITRGLARAICGLSSQLTLGNMDSLRDWGHARDYVYMQWLMLQQDNPKDYVIATGKQISVRDFVKLAAQDLGIELEFRGHGLGEKGIVASIDQKLLAERFGLGREECALRPGQCLISVNPRYFRPAEVETLLGDARKAHAELGWQPHTSLRDMISEMTRQDMRDAVKDSLIQKAGYKVAEKYE